MSDKKWVKVGKIDELKKQELQPIKVNDQHIALSYREGKFGAISGTCLHVGRRTNADVLRRIGFYVSAVSIYCT